MAGLSKAQLDILKNMPGINQSLVSAYEKGGTNLSTEEKTAISSANTSPERIAQIASQPFVKPEIQQSVASAFPTIAAPTNTQKTPTITPPAPEQTSGSDIVSNFSNFNAALNEAVNLARAQRQSAELDFLGGAIQPGAVSASQFTGLLANLNRASTQFTEPLVNNVMDFAKDEAEFRRDQQNTIRELALSLVEQGADQAAIQGVLNAPDIDSAIAVSAGVMQTITPDDLDIRQVGSNLVSVDAEGNVKVLFDGSSKGSGGSTTTPEPMSPNQIEQFRRSYGWTPPAGYSWDQLIGFMQDNPGLTPEQYEKAIIEYNSGFDFIGGPNPSVVIRRTGKVISLPPGTQEDDPIVMETVQANGGKSATNTEVTVSSIKETILGSNALIAGFKNLADAAGVSKMTKPKKKDVENYLRSIESKINEAIKAGYSQEEIIAFLMTGASN